MSSIISMFEELGLHSNCVDIVLPDLALHFAGVLPRIKFYQIAADKLISILDIPRLDIAKKLRRLMAHGHMMKNVKMAILCYSRDYRCTDSDFGKLCANWNLGESDSRRIRAISNATMYKVNAATHDSYMPHTYNEHEVMSSGIYTELTTYIGRLTGKRMYFAQALGLSSLSCIKNELFCTLIDSVYRSFPQAKTRLHLINKVKASVTNKCMSIARDFTKKYKLDDPVNSVNFTTIDYNFSGENSEPTTIVGSKVIDSINDDGLSETSTLVSKVLSKPYDIKGKILGLFMGNKSREFTSWLKDKRVLPSQATSNSGWTKRMISEGKIKQLKKFGRKFLQLDKPEFEQYHEQLKMGIM